jgi:putative thioredoxin
VKFGTGPSQIPVGGKTASPPASAPVTAGGDVVKDTTTAGFMKDVIEASKHAIVLVDFWAEWCGPCKQLTPVIEKIVRSYAGKVRLVKMNIDQHPSIPQQLRVQSIPMVYAFRDGRPLDAFQGALPESQIRAFIDRLVGEEAGAGIEESLAAAQQSFDAGDLQGAAEIYAAILQEDKQNPGALAGLANCYLKSGDSARAGQTIGLVPPDKQSIAVVAQVKAAIELAKTAGSVGDTAALLAKVNADPKDHQARIDLAKAYAAGGKKEEALDQLLEAIRRDRKWNEEAARKQLVQLFEAWGPKDAATLEGRRRLSSILFS